MDGVFFIVYISVFSFVKDLYPKDLSDSLYRKKTTYTWASFYVSNGRCLFMFPCVRYDKLDEFIDHKIISAVKKSWDYFVSVTDKIYLIYIGFIIYGNTAYLILYHFIFFGGIDYI